jgi:hypothetical protein
MSKYEIGMLLYIFLYVCVCVCVCVCTWVRSRTWGVVGWGWFWNFQTVQVTFSSQVGLCPWSPLLWQSRSLNTTLIICSPSFYISWCMVFVFLVNWVLDSCWCSCVYSMWILDVCTCWNVDEDSELVKVCNTNRLRVWSWSVINMTKLTTDHLNKGVDPEICDLLGYFQY